MHRLPFSCKFWYFVLILLIKQVDSILWQYIIAEMRTNALTSSLIFGGLCVPIAITYYWYTNHWLYYIPCSTLKGLGEAPGRRQPSEETAARLKTPP